MSASPVSVPDRPAAADAFVGLGSNGPDRAAALKEALLRLGAAGVHIEAVSPVYETEPVDCTGPLFLNAVARATTSLSPHGLLDALMETERAMGRTRGVAGLQRPIDLDLLLYDDLALSSPTLQVPHPRLVSRRFVLEPLSRLAPDLVIPGQRFRVAVLAKRLARSAPEQRVRQVEGMILT